MQYLFVYGTLLKSLREKLNISFINLGLSSKAYVFGSLYDIGQYPGLILNKTGKVYGELYSLPEDFSFYEVDRYEGFHQEDHHASEFVRLQTEAFINSRNPFPEKTTPFKTWVYVYNKPIEELTKIPGGDYLEYLEQ